MSKTFKLEQGFSLGGWLRDTYTVENREINLPLHSDAYWMAQALRVSMAEVGKPPPNPAVGCVFVKNNQIVAQGATMSFGGLHAERRAIQECVHPENLRGSDCYVTLEPCVHHGKQPPCVEALVEMGIRRCIVAFQDPFPAVNGKGIQYLRQHGVEVRVGVLANECAAWHFPFLRALATSRPVLIGKWAQTLDGHLADDQGRSKWISGAEARQHTHWLRQKYDAIAVGGPTALLDQPSLDVRDCVGPINRHPIKLIYDPHARLLQADSEQKSRISARLLQGEKVYWGIKADKQMASSLSWWLEHEQLILVPLHADKTSFVDFVDEVAKLYPQNHGGRYLQSVLIEGGPRLLSSLIHSGVLDAAHVFMNPSFLGGQNFRIGSLQYNDQAKQSIAIDQRVHFQPLHLQNLGKDLLWDLIAPAAFEQVWGGLRLEES
ncbi:MAG: bifunctional diaminohydroxyphosphoribosylaminopyrimidine deaminase/5-amino-6-(5-phosphoribosylamino)uracil reductase RibD [Oligoflexus sp.]